MNLIAQNRTVIIPVLFPFLERNTRGHWNQSVLNLTLGVRKMLLEMDELLFLNCLSQSREETESQRVESEKRKEAWDRVEVAAKRQQPNGGNIAVLVTSLASFAC